MAGTKFGGAEMEALAAYERALRECVDQISRVGDKLYGIANDMPNNFAFSEYKHRLSYMLDDIYRVRENMAGLVNAVGSERERYYALIDEVSSFLENSAPSEKITCPNCAKPVPSDAKVLCPYCGVELEKAGGDR